tara:strand:- start:5097 stop:5879 length:783 start_codon:yes stop_codon:yes gene_type:complete
MAANRRVDIWNAVERTRASYYKSSIRRTRKGLQEQLKPIMEFLPDRVDELTSSVVEALIEKDPLKEMLTDIYYTVGRRFAKGVFGTLTKAEFTDDLFMRKVIDEVETYGLIMVNDMTDTTKKQINHIISSAFEEGQSIQTTAATIQASINHMTNVRSTMIARTETIRASNQGAMFGADMTGLDLDKEWISTLDSRTRTFEDSDYDHLSMDGQRVDQKAEFGTVSPQDRYLNNDFLRFPADAIGQPGNTINCRCTLAFIPK